MRAFIIVATLFVCLLGPNSFSAFAATPASDDPTEGQLRAVDASGQLRPPCPLEHTDVDVDVAGFVARVTVTQRFLNPFDETIEAVYLFPLSADAAVDRMTMKIGDRTIAGRIALRDEARATYETARAEGRAASLLEQERPNVFTQSVANIPPGARIDVTISYIETLDYEDGRVEFVFPMVVGKRYVLAAAGKADESMSRLSTTTVKSDTRAGHDVSIDVRIDAGVPVSAVASRLHAIETTPRSGHSAVVHLGARDEIPNRDFVLSWDVAGRKLEDAVLAHRDARGGFVTLILQPPDRVAEADLTPKEVVFVVDTSGSMSGLPMEKSKEVVRYAIDRLNPDDTFNVITFSGSTRILFPEPVPANVVNRAVAMQLLSGTQGGGGTEMMSAIRAALDPSDAEHHVRIVCFLTDGYVGNDLEILSEIRKHANARIFAIGVGNSVNRFLLDQMAAEGRGEVAYAMLTDDGEQVAKTFFERVRNPLLTDVTIDWNGLPVTDVLPERIPGRLQREAGRRRRALQRARIGHYPDPGLRRRPRSRPRGAGRPAGIDVRRRFHRDTVGATEGDRRSARGLRRNPEWIAARRHRRAHRGARSRVRVDDAVHVLRRRRRNAGDGGRRSETRQRRGRSARRHDRGQRRTSDDCRCVQRRVWPCRRLRRGRRIRKRHRARKRWLGRWLGDRRRPARDTSGHHAKSYDARHSGRR
ncbi:MAG: VWA domain-containing protein [Blastocatellia bacterium]|nr:VWA domain-containing protein [Blastocatellia bacterium]